jgi:hypothetical protein
VRSFQRHTLLLWATGGIFLAAHIGYMAHFWGFRPLWDLIHSVGHPMGWAGTTAMALSLLYIPRKKKWFKTGSIRFWYRFHVFTGIIGFLLVFFHAYGKYNGVGGLTLLTIWLVWATGIIGYFLRRQLPEELLEQVEERQKALKLIAETEVALLRGSEELGDIMHALEKNGALKQIIHKPRIKLPRPVLAKQPGKLFEFWKDYRNTGHTIKPLKAKVREQVRMEQRRTLLREEEMATLIEVEHAIRNLIFLNELFSLWRKLHVPLSWLMWWFLSLHLFAWLYY